MVIGNTNDTASPFFDEHIPTQGVDILYRKAGWEITCTWPERSGTKEVTTIIGVRHTGIPPVLVQAPKRLNLYSATGVNGIATSMRRVKDDTISCDELLQHVCADLLGWYRRGNLTIRPDPAREQTPAGWIVYPVWPKTGVTGVAASREHFKSMFAQALALQAASAFPFLPGNTRTKQPQPGLYADWEGDEDTFTLRMSALLRGAELPLTNPGVAYRNMMGLPLADAVYGLRDEIGERGYRWLVIDSMSAAISGPMVEDDEVNRFYSALTQLAVPTLVLAHKSDENQRKKRHRFFGSTMSENRVRMAWGADRAENGTELVWECFKDNNHGLKGSRLGFRVAIGNRGVEEERVMESVRIDPVNPDSVSVELAEGATIGDRAAALLADGPVSASDLATGLGLSYDTVRRTLTRYPGRFCQDGEKRWALSGNVRSDVRFKGDRT